MTILLIGDLMINEYELLGYQVRVSIDRQTCRLVSIVLESTVLGEQATEVYYGSIANELHTALISAKVSKALGGQETTDLKQFSRRGFRVQESRA